MKNQALLTQVYTKELPRITRYIAARVNDPELARDLAQDTFMRLLESTSLLLYPEALAGLVYRTARNVVYDWLRRYYVRQEADSYLAAETETMTDEVNDTVHARELARLERERIELLSPRRRDIYCLRRFEGLSAKDIAQRLQLSHRTVENHLLAATHQVRSQLRQVI